MNQKSIVNQLHGYERCHSVYETKIHRITSSQPEQDDIIGTIFAPDPVTGIPRCDLAIVMSKSSAPEIGQYIRDQLMRPIDNGVSTDDAQLALDMTMTKMDSFEAYAARLRELSQSEINKSE